MPDDTPRNPYILEKPETYYLVYLRRGPTYHNMARDPRTQAGHFTIDVIAWMGDSEAWRPR